MPRRNNIISGGAQKKFNGISLATSDGLYPHEIYVLQAKAKAVGDEGEQAATNIGFMNLLNTNLRGETPAKITIELTTVDKLPSNNGTIKCRVLGGAESPLSTQTQGGNTLEWLENNENITLELEIPLPQTTAQYFFFFTDPFHNQVPVDPTAPDGLKKIGAIPFYKTKATPKIDSLNSNNEIIGQFIEATASLSAFLMNEETGASQEIDLTTSGGIPTNARYAKIEFETFNYGHNIEIQRDGVPLSLTYIDKGNAESLGITDDNFISDEYYIDLIDPRQSLAGNQTKPIIRSTMSGEIHNKFRIWDTLFIGQDSAGDFDIPFGVNTTDADGKIHLDFGNDWKQLIPNTEYVVLLPPSLSPAFNNDIVDAFKGGNAGGAPTPWYNEFSFFQNYYSKKDLSSDVGNPLWKTSNSFLSFDVERAVLIGLLVDSFAIANPKLNIINYNLSDEDYRNIVRSLWTTGQANINGITFNGWPQKWGIVTKDDNIYNWPNDEENKKYLCLTPKLSYIERYQKLMNDGGQGSSDNNVNLKLGNFQTTSARHPFPTGSGSVDIHYPSSLAFSRPYSDSHNWPTEHKVVFDLGSEGTIQNLLINNWAGIRYRITYYDNNFALAKAVNSNGEPVELTPLVIKAPNVDNRNQPLSTSIQIVYGV